MAQANPLILPPSRTMPSPKASPFPGTAPDFKAAPVPAEAERLSAEAARKAKEGLDKRAAETKALAEAAAKQAEEAKKKAEEAKKKEEEELKLLEAAQEAVKVDPAPAASTPLDRATTRSKRATDKATAATTAATAAAEAARQAADAARLAAEDAKKPPALDVKLRIVRATFGDREARETCDATPFFIKACHVDDISASPTTLIKDGIKDPSYCYVKRAETSANVRYEGADLCGYKPSPQGINELIVEYKCVPTLSGAATTKLDERNAPVQTGTFPGFVEWARLQCFE